MDNSKQSATNNTPLLNDTQVSPTNATVQIAQSASDDATETATGTQQGTSQPAVTAPSQARRQVQQPVSTPGNKEHAPVATTTNEAPAEVTVSHVEQVPKIPDELKELGVEASPEVKEQEEPKKVEFVPVAPEPTPAPESVKQEPVMQAPMTVEQAMVTSKSGSVWNSARWLATAILYQLKKLQQNITQTQ